MSDTDLSDLKAKFRNLLELRIKRDEDKAAADASGRAFREAEAELYAEMEDAGMRGRISFDFGGDLGKAGFQLRRTVYGRVIDKDTAIQALEAEGLGDVIFDKSVREKRLNELVRDRMEARDGLPDGIDFYDRKGVSISRS